MARRTPPRQQDTAEGTCARMKKMGEGTGQAAPARQAKKVKHTYHRAVEAIGRLEGRVDVVAGATDRSRDGGIVEGPRRRCAGC